MLKIFISYAREDKTIAEGICELFERNGYDVWMDIKKLVPGQDWKLEIEKAIQGSDIFISCLSTHSVDKIGYVQAELRRALEVAELMPEGRIYIVPVRLDMCEVPNSLKDLHWVNYFEMGSDEMLLRAVQEGSKNPDRQRFYTNVYLLNDESKEGPSLFSLALIHRPSYYPIEWISRKYKLTLWCEHSRLPLPAINGISSKRGVYEFEVLREWFMLTAPYLKFVSYSLLGTMIAAIVLIPLVVDASTYRAIQGQLIASSVVFGLILLPLIRTIDIFLHRDEQLGEWGSRERFSLLEPEKPIRAQGAVLRKLHVFLKSKDPGFGELVRVINKRQEFLWVHERFVNEY